MSLLNKVKGSLKGLVKIAGVEYPNQEQVEGDFGALAHQFVSDRADMLMPYMIGFEVVERNSSGSRVVGVFAFKISGKIYFIPVFFINGQIKGMVSLYDRDTNTFSQLTDSNISKILTPVVSDMGNTVDRRQMAKEVDYANMAGFSNPYAKIASSAIRGAWCDMANHASTALLDPDIKREFSNLVLSTKEAEFTPYESDDSELRYLLTWLGPRAEKTINDRILGTEKMASAVDMLYGNATAFKLRSGDFFKTAKEFDDRDYEVDGIHVKVVSNLHELSDEVTDENRKYFQEHGFEIEDKRDTRKLSELYMTDEAHTLTSPEVSGSYEIFGADGKFHKATIFLANTENKPLTSEGGAFILINGTGMLYSGDPSDILVKYNHATKEDLSKNLWKKGVKPSSSSIKIDNFYAVVNNSGKCEGVYDITGMRKEPGSPTTYAISDPEYNVPRAIASVTTSRRTPVLHDLSRMCTFPSNLIIRKGDASGARRSGKALIISSEGHRLIDLGRGARDNRADVSDGTSYNDPYSNKPFSLGTMSDYINGMYKEGFAKVSIRKDNGSLDTFDIISDVASNGSLNTKQATVLLTLGYNIDADTSKTIMKYARDDGEASFLVRLKSAQARLPEDDVFIPPYMFPEFTRSDSRTGTLIQDHSPEILTSHTISSLPPQNPLRPGIDDEAFSGSSNPESTDMEDIDDVFQLAEMAAETGQRTVFDHAGIAGLSKLYDVGSLLDSYIPEMMKSVDRLGRLLFLFYWRNQGFSERFGEDSMPEIEDTLLTIYRQFGDLVIKLGEKPISTDAGTTF